MDPQGLMWCSSLLSWKSGACEVIVSGKLRACILTFKSESCFLSVIQGGLGMETKVGGGENWVDIFIESSGCCLTAKIQKDGYIGRQRWKHHS
ncbi:hypothetical protein L1049_006769 [Liquidambar formosana]|uniref:Uncharacterized protein n=1 Tax=Liquidambar formosana TaxID=63359 RepID=A0AAP0RG27_LIQFO